MSRRVIIALVAGVVMTLGLSATAVVGGFSDVPDDYTHARGIQWASDNNLVVGYPDGTFRPGDGVTRGQLATLLKRYFDNVDKTADAVDVMVDIEGLCELFGEEPGSQACRDAIKGDAGVAGPQGPAGTNGTNGVSGYRVFTSVQDFGPGGIGGAWCGAPNANTTDQGWVVLGGGAKFTDVDINAGVAVASSWPSPPGTNGGDLDGDPLNPGWSIQVNKPPNVNPGEVTLYAVCAKIAG